MYCICLKRKNLATPSVMRKLVTFFAKCYRAKLQPHITSYLASKIMTLEDWLISVGDNRRGDILSVFFLSIVTGRHVCIYLHGGKMWSTLQIVPTNHNELLNHCDLHLVYMGFGTFLRLIRRLSIEANITVTLGEITSDNLNTLATLVAKIKQEQEFTGTTLMMHSTVRKPTAAAGSASQLSLVKFEIKAETNAGV